MYQGVLNWFYCLDSLSVANVRFRRTYLAVLSDISRCRTFWALRTLWVVTCLSPQELHPALGLPPRFSAFRCWPTSEISWLRPCDRLEWTRCSYSLVYTNVQQIIPAIPPTCPNVEWKFTVNAAVMSSSIRHVISSLRDYKFTNSITRLHKYLPVGRNDKRRFPLILLSHCTLFFHNFTC